MKSHGFNTQEKYSNKTCSGPVECPAKLTYAVAGTDYKHGEVRVVTSQSGDGSLQVFVMATQVQQLNDFGRICTDLGSCSGATVVHNLQAESFVQTYLGTHKMNTILQCKGYFQIQCILI